MGSASEGILRTAAEVDADLIAMGTHGRTGLRRLIAGSAATDVLRGARCSVLALRRHGGAPTAREVRVILHPTDFSRASEAASAAARALARDLGARLIVMHVIPLELDLDGGLAGALDPGEDRRSLDAIRERLDGPELKYTVEDRLGRGRVAGEILRTAREVACDLIVLGTHGRTGLGRLLLGNVAESVVPWADCAVLIVKAPQHQPVPGLEAVAVEAESVP
jgi:nucleotide-binding universal stress UspA family protein